LPYMIGRVTVRSLTLDAPAMVELVTKEPLTTLRHAHIYGHKYALDPAACLRAGDIYNYTKILFNFERQAVGSFQVENRRPAQAAGDPLLTQFDHSRHIVG